MKQVADRTLYTLCALGCLTLTTDSTWATWTQLQVGMSAKKVGQLIGSPTEIRPKNPRSHLHKEAYRWAYGSHTKGGFAQQGVLIFNAKHKLLHIYRPTKPQFFRAKPRHRLQKMQPERTRTGMQCVLAIAPSKSSKATLSKGEIPPLKISLQNRGRRAFKFRHNYTGIHANLVVELYDSKKRLIWRQDQGVYHSPVAPRPKAKWPTIPIAAGRSHSTVLNVSHALRFYGRLAPGTYFIRVGFPFQAGRYYRSNSLPITTR